MLRRVLVLTGACVLSLVGAAATLTWAWDVYVHPIDNALDLCGTSVNPSDVVVPLDWYRGVPYAVEMPADQGPVYFDSSHLGSFEGVYLAGILGSSEAERVWTVRSLRPGESFDIPPSYQNLHTFAYIPECGNLSDNSGLFNLKIRPTGWGIWPSLPTEGVGVVAILDPVSGVVYVFGGACANASYSNVTWRLDPNGFGGWVPIEAGGAGPEPRWFASAIYDPNPGGHRRMIIFGGASESQQGMSDTWALDLETLVWSSVSVQGTAPSCMYHRAVLDPNPSGNRRMLVYGDAHHIDAETWALDLVTYEWTLLHDGTDAPPLRNLPGLALYEPEVGNRQMLAFGGGHLSTYLNDIWSLDLETLTWTELPPGEYGPPGTCEGASMVTDSPAGKAIVFGGRNAQEAYDDLWYYDLEGLGWVPVNFPQQNWPAARAYHGMVYDQEYDAVIVIGGTVGTYPCEEATVAVYVTDFEWFGGVEGVEPQGGADAAALRSRSWPVPSERLTQIEFDLPETGPVDAAVFGVSGARLATLASEVLPAGTHRLAWNGRADSGVPVAAGVYYYRVQARDHSTGGKIVIAK